MDFMFARARFLRYPNLAGNSEFQQFDGCEKAERETLFGGQNWVFWSSKRGRFARKNRKISQKLRKTTINRREFWGCFVDAKRVKWQKHHK
jgi:hypothetical protein